MCTEKSSPNWCGKGKKAYCPKCLDIVTLPFLAIRELNHLDVEVTILLAILRDVMVRCPKTFGHIVFFNGVMQMTALGCP